MKEPECVYTTRSLPTRLRQRVRVLATLEHVSMESIVNEALEIGLAELEKARRAKVRPADAR